jgi:hypothetical protein
MGKRAPMTMHTFADTKWLYSKTGFNSSDENGPKVQ